MIADTIHRFDGELQGRARLIAVTKTKPVPLLQEAYDAGCRLFGENKVQEMADKQPQLPADVQWHLIGQQAAKHNRVIDCLLQIHIASEETKFGLSPDEADALLHAPELDQLTHVRVIGLMGLATNTDDQDQVRREFRGLKQLYDEFAGIQRPSLQFRELSMGMSGDYRIAVDEGSTLVRIGSAIFGARP